MLIGYARISTTEQNLDLQKRRPQGGGVREDRRGHRQRREGPAVAASTAPATYSGTGDVLVVWRLTALAAHSST